MRPFLFGKDVERWHVGWEGWWVVFPYFQHKGHYLFMPSSEYWEFTVKTKDGTRRVFERWPDDSPLIDKTYPRLYTYLKANEKALRRREGGRWKRKKNEEWRWYDLAYPRSIEIAEQKKIVAQLLARSAQFALENQGGFHFQAGGKGGGVYGILLKQEFKELFFLGLLNSRTLDFYLRHITQVYNSSGSSSYADAYLKWLPIVDVASDQQHCISDLAQSLTAKTAELRQLEGNIAAFPASVTEAWRAEGKVPDLDDLSRLVTWSNLARNISYDSVSEQTDLRGNTVLSAGRGSMTLEPALARLVLQVLELRGRMTREELLGLEVPTDASEQAAYLQTLAEWQASTESLKGEIEQQEAELNNVVYEAYELDEEAQRIIRAFLERF